jgi:[acyl-carrier-protein] S-malonyltransferase
MGKALAAAHPESRAVLEEADQALGLSLSALCFGGPEEDLQRTANTQPAILAISVAALRAVEARGFRSQWVAGHSLGEYSALVAAGTSRCPRRSRRCANAGVSCRRRCRKE